jgi:hypothetical protein
MQSLRTVAFCRNRLAYSSGGCAGMFIEVIDEGTGFPFHLPLGRGARHLKRDNFTAWFEKVKGITKNLLMTESSRSTRLHYYSGRQKKRQHCLVLLYLHKFETIRSVAANAISSHSCPNRDGDKQTGQVTVIAFVDERETPTRTTAGQPRPGDTKPFLGRSSGSPSFSLVTFPHEQHRTVAY